ncbi:hypothetical protein L3X37_00760 [Sabulilitoribacter arenilitoris]|uniref:Outer membrane protein beta-barrel domain-containing protein n=1 Tax=Wocania arenilitoris TaxID=2044858 RepID=A0AAE3EN50_9FLAO|nr:DUF6646 family protein [Wocania arenilitoris]MCF7566895.1 hypothetical protein [Wocania arenilitoris]
MKKLIFVFSILSVSLVNAQAYIGKNDNKFQVGANLQNNGTGLNVSYDYGVGENISFGFSSTYLLGVEDLINVDFGDRFDIRARFNANLGNVINIDENFDVYPGLSFGLRNFGGHIGMRYFFSDGFGIYTEFNTPLAKYKTGVLTPAEKLHNQFTVNLGASFNL